jgi:protein-tyrosine kinase
MSRVHDALRRAERLLDAGSEEETAAVSDDHAALIRAEQAFEAADSPGNGIVRREAVDINVDWRNFLDRCPVIAFHPAPETHLIDAERPHEVPAEEFRSLRTRLNHLQSQQELHSLVVTSASPAEGKTFTAVNLAIAQAQLETPVLLADLDLRRPTVHNLLQCERSPGFSDFLLSQKPLEECIRRVGDTNLYFMPAGTQVKNPLEILNLRHVKQTLEGLRKIFNWIVLDTPPLLFSADANLLSTMTDGTLIVVRIGSTTYDNVIRAMQTLCENNVVGIVANGARAGELYSKYTYYYSKPDEETEEAGEEEEPEQDEE